MNQLPQSVKRRMAASPVPEVHPEADLLTAFAEQTLAPGEREQVLMHLSACADCREILALASPDIEVPGAAAAPLPVPSNWQFFRWGTLAASMTIIAIVVLVRGPEMAQKQPGEIGGRTVTRDAAPPKNEAGEKDQSQSAIGNQFESKAAEGPTRSDENSFSVEAPAISELRARMAQPPVPAPAPPPEAEMTANAAPPVSEPPSQAPGGSTQSYAALSAKDKAAEEQQGRGESRAFYDYSSVGSGQGGTAPQAVAAQSAPAKPASSPKLTRPEWDREQKAAEAQASQMADADAKREAARESKASAAAPTLLAKHAASQDVTAWRWRAREGKLQRSQDGKSWDDVQIAEGVTISSVTVSGKTVWASGGGMLYHSSDGARWERSQGFTGAVREIEFSSFLDGRLMTTTGEIWVTRDGGYTWEKQSR